MDRRQFLFGSIGALAVSAIPAAVRAQVNDRLAVLTAGGTNVVALRSGNALVLADSGTPALADALMRSLAERKAPSERDASAERTTVFNTHWHLENTGANERLRDAGAEIIAHEQTRVWMSTPTWLPAEDRYRQPRPKNAQPTKTFYVNGSMTAGAEHIEYGYLIEAHTSGDIYVFFRDSNVLAAGDVASPSRDPELDYLTGAWIGGRLDALTKLVSLANADTRIVPGFGPVITRAQLQAERDMMKTIYERGVDRIRAGDSPDDMLAAGVLKDLPRTFADPKKFIYAVHKGLWAHHNKLHPNIV
jgi:cyclase